MTAGARAPIAPPPRGGAEREHGRFPWIVAALGSAATVVLCVALSIGAWFATDGGKKIAGVGASATPTAITTTATPAPTAVAATAVPTVLPAVTPITPSLSGTVTPVLPIRWLTPKATAAPNVTATPTPSAVTWANYVNSVGNYTLRYPTLWSGIDIGGDASFETPDDFSIEITVDSATAGKTAADYARDPSSLGSARVLASAPTQINEESAMRLEVAERGASQMTAVLYVTVRNGQLYLFALRGLEEHSAEEINSALRLFEELVKSFRFTR